MDQSATGADQKRDHAHRDGLEAAVEPLHASLQLGQILDDVPPPLRTDALMHLDQRE